MATEEYDVIIIGAGISGLSAAKLLKESGQNVIVLEARDRVGGRTYTLRDPSYNYTDAGGAYVGPGQNRVYRMAKELGLEFYDVNEKEKAVLNFRGNWSTFHSDKNEVPTYNIFKILDLNHVQQTLDNMALEVPLDAPWKAEKAEEWDSMTVKQFLDKTAWTNITKSVFKIIGTAILTSELHEISLLYFLWYIHSGGGITRLQSVTNGAQEKKFVGGSMQLSEKMAEKLEDRVLLSRPVVDITQKEDTIMVSDSLGNKYTSKYVICSVPQSILNRIHFHPPLPSMKQQLIQRMPMGSIIKTMMFYSEPFWRDLDFSGMAISDHGPCAFCIDDTKPDGTCAAIMGFILADQCREYVEMTEEERKNALCEHYSKAFKCDKFMHPINYVEKNWMEEEYSGGCYVSVMPPGVLTKYGKYLREPIGQIYFAGTESATVWAGYMDGAIQSGERAAREILFHRRLINEYAVFAEEPDSEDYPNTPITISRRQRILPSINQLLYFFSALTFGFLAYRIYPYVTGWRGAILLRWFKWSMDI